MAKTYRNDEINDIRAMRKSYRNFKGTSMRKTENKQAIRDSFREDYEDFEMGMTEYIRGIR